MTPELQWHWILTNAPNSWAAILCVLGFLILLVMVALLYRREEGTMTNRMRRLLIGCRCLILLLIAGALLGPAVMKIRSTSQEPVVLLLLDDSASMSINDAENPRSRSELVEDLLQRNKGEFIAALGRKGSVRIMTIDDSVKLRQVIGGTTEAAAVKLPSKAEELDIPQGSPVPPLSAKGQTTDLAIGIRDAIQSVGSQPIAGLVVISDGQNTAGLDPRVAATEAGSAEVPIFAIGVGSTVKPVNVRLRELHAPELAFLGDPVLLSADIEVTMHEDRAVSVSLYETKGTADGKPVLVETRELQLGPNAAKKTVTFSHKPTEAGAMHYLARVEPLPGELLETDNERGALVRIVKQKARVLLVAGQPSWDYRLLRNLLLRESAMELSCWLQSRPANEPQPGTKPIRQLPRTQEDWKPYQLVLLLDPNPERLPTRFFDELEAWVRGNAGGLLYMPGPLYSSSVLSSKTSPIRRLLPVRLPKTFSPPRSADSPASLILTADGGAHPLAQVCDSRGSVGELWRQIPPVHWYIGSAKVQPGSMAILVASSQREAEKDNQPNPVLAAGRYGQGRTIFVGINGTWRWRSVPGQLFERFWVQAVRYLLEGDMLRRQGAGRIELDRQRYNVGSPMRCSVRLFNTEDLQPADKLVVTVTDPQGETRTQALEPVPEQLGRFEGILRADRTGPHRIEAAVPGSKEILAAHAAIEPPNREFDNPAMDVALLTDLAAKSGGKYVPIGDAGSVPEMLPDRRIPLVIPGEPKPVWDNVWFLLTLVVLLSLEWGLRRRCRLL